MTFRFSIFLRLYQYLIIIDKINFKKLTRINKTIIIIHTDNKEIKYNLPSKCVSGNLINNKIIEGGEGSTQTCLTWQAASCHNMVYPFKFAK